MCNCGDLKYSKKNHTHNYATQAEVDAAIAASGHVDQAAVDAAIAASGHVDQAAVDAAIAASGHVDQAAVDAAIANAGHIDQAALDAAIAAAVDAAVPVGSIKMWGGASDPPGGKWMICNGRLLDKDDYPGLFAVTSYAFGFIDPGQFFGIPDFRERVPIGVGGGYSRGQNGGEAQHTLTVGEMPSHGHQFAQGDGANRTAVAWGTSPGNGTGIVRNLGGATTYSPFIEPTGGGQAHNNLPPYLAVNYIIKVLQ